MYIYVYINLCMYVYVYICIYVYMYICICVYMYMCIYMYQSIRIHSSIRTVGASLKRTPPHGRQNKSTNWSSIAHMHRSHAPLSHAPLTCIAHQLLDSGQYLYVWPCIFSTFVYIAVLSYVDTNIKKMCIYICIH